MDKEPERTMRRDTDHEAAEANKTCEAERRTSGGRERMDAESVEQTRAIYKHERGGR